MADKIPVLPSPLLGPSIALVYVLTYGWLLVCVYLLLGNLVQRVRGWSRRMAGGEGEE